MWQNSVQNKTVVLTRQSEDNKALKKLLIENKINVIEMPCFDIAYVKPDNEETKKLLRLDEYEAITFSSKHGVIGFFVWLETQAEIRNQIRPRIVAAVGPKTALKLAEKNWNADIIANPATGEQLAVELLLKIAPAARILAIRGNTSRDVSGKILSEKGCTIHKLTVYENRQPLVNRVYEDYDLVVYTSPLGAKRFIEKNSEATKKKSVAIGTTTGDYLKELGMTPELSLNTDENALMDAIVKALR